MKLLQAVFVLWLFFGESAFGQEQSLMVEKSPSQLDHMIHVLSPKIRSMIADARGTEVQRADLVGEWSCSVSAAQNNLKAVSMQPVDFKFEEYEADWLADYQRRQGYAQNDSGSAWVGEREHRPGEADSICLHVIHKDKIKEIALMEWVCPRTAPKYNVEEFPFISDTISLASHRVVQYAICHKKSSAVSELSWRLFKLEYLNN